MADFVRDLSKYAVTLSGDHYAKNIYQVQQSDGSNPVSCTQNFYGISADGDIFNLASISVTETGTDTRTAGLSFNVFDSNGIATPILDVSPSGMTVSGGFSVTGGATTFETSIIEVADKDLVLANGASTIGDLDLGGLILGTDDSGTKTILFDATNEYWNSNTSINIDAGKSFSVGANDVLLDSNGLLVGDISLTAGSLTLSSDVSLKTTGLEIGDISLSSASGLEIGPDITMNSLGISLGSIDPVVITTSGINIGSDIVLDTTSGLGIGTDVSLNSSGLTMGTVDPVTLSTAGLVVGGDLSLTTTGGLSIGTDISLTTSGGLQVDDISLTSAGLALGTAVTLDSDGLVVGTDLVLNTTDGLLLGTDVNLSTSGLSIGALDPTIIDDTSVSLGSDVLLNHDGLNLINEDSSIFMGNNTWKIKYDSSTQNLLFQFYDTTSSSYVTKMEIKNAGS